MRDVRTVEGEKVGVVEKQMLGSGVKRLTVICEIV